MAAWMRTQWWRCGRRGLGRLQQRNPNKSGSALEVLFRI